MKYLIKIWENENLRDLGISDIVETDIDNIQEAISKAKKIMENNNYASIEVQTNDEEETVYHKSTDEEKYFYNLPQDNVNEKIKYIVQMYFAENELNNLMDYGSDRDSLAMPSLSSLYSELIGKLGIETNNIQTEDVSDGKYGTIIEFKNGKGISIETSAGNGTEIITNNLKSIYEEYKKMYLKKYESIIIMNPSMSEEQAKAEINKYKEYLEQLSSKPVEVEEIGKKKLAYTVNKFTEGNYAIFYFYGKSEDISELERRYRSDDDILKFLTVRKDEELENSESIEEDMEM